ncbi:unnamed protein product, partial [marine sediment metagenome]
ERTGIKAGEFPGVPGPAFLGGIGGGAMTLEDMQELHAAYVKNQELLAVQAGYMNDMAVSTHAAAEAIEWFIPAMEEEINVLDGSEIAIADYLDSIAAMNEQTMEMANIITGDIFSQFSNINPLPVMSYNAVVNSYSNQVGSCYSNRC